MIPFAALTGVLPKTGIVVLAALVAGVLLAKSARLRALSMLGALVVAPALLLADIWHSPQLHSIHRHPLFAALAAALALLVVGGLAILFARRPTWFALLTVAALPFRVPIQAGGTTSNLLVPLYLVVAAGAVAFIVPTLLGLGRGLGQAAPGDTDGEPRALPIAAGWIERLLALYVCLYAVQAVYSPDFEKALQQMVFFYVPFALLLYLLKSVSWTPRLLRLCLELVVALALLFAAIGFAEYATKTIILNPKLVVANDLHAYFTVNSVFFDPDIFGRFLALVMILVAAVLLYARRRRDQLIATGVLAVLWAALVLTLSRSSLGALLVGLAVLAALRWRPSRTLWTAAGVVAIGLAAVLISPKTFGLNQGLNGASSGRSGLVSGGVSMFKDRPLWGYGSGGFVHEYRARHPRTAQSLSASHTIPVTIAAEQGLIGLLAYLALVLVAVVALLRRARSDPARAAIAAAFIALVFHTLLYADFLEDPMTWTLLGIGVALAARARAVPAPDARARRRRGDSKAVAASA